MARGHEQAIALDASEADIGASFGQGDEADRFSCGIEHLHSILLRIPHAPAAPEVAIDIAAKTVRRSAGLGGYEGAAVDKLGAVIGYVVDADHAWGDTRLNDVHFLFVRREAKTIRTIDIAGDHSGVAGLVEPVDVGRQLGCGDVTFVVAEDAERRIGKPDRVIGFHHDVVW